MTKFTPENEREWQNFHLKIIEEKESSDNEENNGDDEDDHHPAVEEPHEPLLVKIWKWLRFLGTKKTLSAWTKKRFKKLNNFQLPTLFKRCHQNSINYEIGYLENEEKPNAKFIKVIGDLSMLPPNQIHVC